MKHIFTYAISVLFPVILFAQDDWNNWKPYSTESYYDIQKKPSEKKEKEGHDIYKPKFM